MKYLLITNESVFSYRNISGEVGRTLYEDEVVDGDLYLIDGVLDLNGHTLIINGDLIQSCGTIKVNGGKLIINKSYRIQTRTETEENYSYSANMTYGNGFYNITGFFSTEELFLEILNGVYFKNM